MCHERRSTVVNKKTICQKVLTTTKIKENREAFSFLLSRLSFFLLYTFNDFDLEEENIIASNRTIASI